MKALSLYELNQQIKQVLTRNFTHTMWVVAEITELSVNSSSGHCYLQLIEKKSDGGIIASARANIWSFAFKTLKPYFEETTGRRFERGLKILVEVEVIFHEMYGYSLNIKNIDPNYTLGDLERRKQEILQQLKAEGIIDMNRELEFPLLPKNIAIISSPTAAGYGDFITQISNNTKGYHFHTKLFPAIMQGEQTTDSVIAALDKIHEHIDIFDVVIIIRGGGSQTDLASFDSYDIAANIAQFPIPIIAGIGHERDNTIADRAAHMKVKTPTAAAVLLIEHFDAQNKYLNELQEDFIDNINNQLTYYKQKQQTLITEFKHLSSSIVLRQKHILDRKSQQILNASSIYMQDNKHKLSIMLTRTKQGYYASANYYKQKLQKNAEHLPHLVKHTLSKHAERLELATVTTKYANPSKILERGFSITRINGKAVNNPSALRKGDIIETELAQGAITSEVK